MTRGDNFDQDTGIVIKPTSFTLRAAVVPSSGNYNVFRLIVFQWNDAGTPAPTGILAAVGIQNAPLQPFYWPNRSRFNVLYDKCHTLSAYSATQYGVIWDVDISLQNTFRPMHLIASGAGTTPVRGGVYFLVIADDGLTPYPAFNYVTELVYTDA